MSQVAGLEVGQPVEGVFAVRRKERRLSRQGDPYLMLTLADASGAIGAFVFDQPDFFAEKFETGDRVRVAGQVVARQGRPAVRVRHIRPAGDEVAAEEFLPRSHREPEELAGFAEHLAGEIADPVLRTFTLGVLGDRSLADGWRTAPCTRSGHHAYQGGLLEHTVGVASLAQTLCQWHPRLDADLLVAAALVHDVGHIRAWRLGATFELTDEGRMLGHLAIGHEILDAAARRAGMASDRRLALLHAVAWHHGPPPGQVPAAASPEALALWRVNSLEVGVKARLEGPGPIDETGIA
jgi:3'-5' exoribonuclease